LLNYSASNTRNSILDNPSGIYSRSQFDVFTNNVRFFAAPFIKEKPKEKEEEPTGPRINENITDEVVRLVTEEGNDILPFNEALRRAKTLKLDLVEVDRKAVPPVCKLMDYKREQYRKLIAKKERAKGKTEVGLKNTAPVKEVRFKTKVEAKDMQCKVDTAMKLMEKGYRVKFYVQGRADEDIAATLSRVCALIEDTCIVESGPAVEKLVAYVVVRHAKFGPTKKGLIASKIVVPPRVYEPKMEKKGKMDKQERRAARALEKSTGVDDEADEDSDFVPRENLANNDASSGPNRYKKVPDAPPPRGSNFQGNPRPDAGRYGGVQSDNSTYTPNRYAQNRPGGAHSDNSTAPPNRYASTPRRGGTHSDNSTAPPNRYAPTNRPGGAHSDNSAAPPNRYAPTSRPGGAPSDNSAAPPNRYAERRRDVRSR
jgi:translation initiation factor IF-3